MPAPCAPVRGIPRKLCRASVTSIRQKARGLLDPGRGSTAGGFRPNTDRDDEIGENSARRRPEISAGADAGRRHRRPRAAQALAGAVPPRHRRLHPVLPHRWRFARPTSTSRASAPLVKRALDKFSPRKATDEAWRHFAAADRLCAAQRRRRGAARRGGRGRGGSSAPRRGGCIISACRRTRRCPRCGCSPTPA